MTQSASIAPSLDPLDESPNGPLALLFHPVAPQDRRETCPFCGYEDCQADWVDIGVGLQQAGPFACDNCGACAIGVHDSVSEISFEERRVGWYRPSNARHTSAPTFGGKVVSSDAARILHRYGALDAKVDP